MRGKTRRAWIKLYITGMLHGSVRWELTAEERSVWVDLLLLAGECGRGGKVSDNDGKALPVGFIANHLNIKPELLERTIKKCEDGGRVKRVDGVIEVVNWNVYQSEYERQKPYRDVRKSPNESKEEFELRLKLSHDTGEPPEKEAYLESSKEEVRRAIRGTVVDKAKGIA